MKMDTQNNTNAKRAKRRAARKQRKKNRKLQRLFEAYADYVADHVSIEEIADKSDLLNRLQATALATMTPGVIIMDVFDVQDPLTIEKIIQFVEQAEPQQVQQLIKIINEKITQHQKEQYQGEELGLALQLEAEPLGIEVYIIEFVQYSPDYFGIKIQLGTNVYLFDFEGTIHDLKESLLDEIHAQAGDIIGCPFCNKEHLRSALSENPGCECGAIMITESMHDGTGWSPELATLWRAGCSFLGISLPKKYKHQHIDKFFANVRYMGRGNTNWRTWVVREPWERLIKKIV